MANRRLPNAEAQAFRYARARLGVSQAHWAVILGISRGYLNAIERGRATPSWKVRLRYLTVARQGVPDHLK